mmetsp:Transcript_73010/g.205075  ORF Transcript_73010/g.205075 Transcript_73010/m.205075 type:complete len:238 (+) Transcript_73010:77-790(+)
MTEATANFRRHMGGGAAGGLVNPRAPQLCRDHAKDNIRAMREKERQMRGQRLLQAQQRPAEPFKMRQFSDAKSRLFEARGTPKGARANGPNLAQLNNGEDGEEIGLDDFEAQVANLIRQHGKKQQGMQQMFTKDSKGCPAYLRKRKEEFEEQRRAEEAERSRPKLPAGYRQLPPEEVAETLDALKKKREDLEKEFRALPLKIETDSQKRRQKAVLQKIEESDRAIKIFSQPTVLVEA